MLIPFFAGASELKAAVDVGNKQVRLSINIHSQFNLPNCVHNR